MRSRRTRSVLRSTRTLRSEALEQRMLLSVNPIDPPDTSLDNVAEVAPAPYDSVVVDSYGTFFGVNILQGASGLVPIELGSSTTLIEEIAFSPAGELYGVQYDPTSGGGGELYLIEIVPGTGVTLTPVDSLEIPGDGGSVPAEAITMHGMEFDRDGVLYGVGENLSSTDHWVFQIDPATGVTTPVAPLLIDEVAYTTSPTAGDLEFDSNGTMYVTTDQGAVLRKTLGASVLQVVGDADCGYDDIAGLTYYKSGQGVLLGFRSKDTLGNRVVKLSMGTGEASAFGDLSLTVDAVHGAATTLSYDLPNLVGLSFDAVNPVDPATPVVAGDAISVDFEVENNRPEDAGAFLVSFFLSTDTTFGDGTDHWLGNFTIGSLAANTSTGVLTATWTTPPPGTDIFLAGDGTYYVGMIVDSGGAIVEADENDNSGVALDQDHDALEFTVPNAPPTIDSLWGDWIPATSITRPRTVTLDAWQVEDVDGSVERVDFYHETNGEPGLQTDVGGDTLIVDEAATPVSDSVTFSINTYGLGLHTFHAQAIDDLGEASLDGLAAASTSVTIENVPPTMVLLDDQPDPLWRPTDLTLEAVSVADVDGTIVSVAFYLESNGLEGLQPGSDTLLQEDTDGTDGWSTTRATGGLPAGTYTYHAMVTDNEGGTTPTGTSAPRADNTIQNLAPVLSVLAVDANPVGSGDTVLLSAGASDTDGTVTSVSFYGETNGLSGLQTGTGGDTLLGTDSTGADGWEQTFTTPDPTLGTVEYIFHAIATDNEGGASDVNSTTLTVEGDIVWDFGDAPDDGGATVPSYPTLLASSGARHQLLAGWYLGSEIDYEDDAAPTATADGDDTTFADDEDGIVFATNFGKGAMARIIATASRTGIIDAWIDFNADGDWDDLGERVVNTQVVVPGANDLVVQVPTSAALGSTFARFRYSPFGVSSHDGEVVGGEVEDYQIQITELPITEDPLSGRLTIQGTPLADNLVVTLGDLAGPLRTFQVEINDFTIIYNVGDFDELVFDGAGADDTAKVIGLPTTDDVMTTHPGEASFVGGGLTVEITNTEDVTLDGGTGGSDVANMYDSPEDDTFVTSPLRGEMTDLTGWYRSLVIGTRTVVGHATDAGNDSARMTDSAGNDFLIANPTIVWLHDSWDVIYASFASAAVGFESVTAHSEAGGSDLAFLNDSDGDDILRAAPMLTTLTDVAGTYSQQVVDFYNVVVLATGYADRGHDVAHISGSAGNDKITFRASKSAATAIDRAGNSLDYRIRTKFFDRTIFRAGEGNDRVKIIDSSGVDRLVAKDSMKVKIRNVGDLAHDYYFRAVNIESAIAVSNRGPDRARVFAAVDWLLLRGDWDMI